MRPQLGLAQNSRTVFFTNTDLIPKAIPLGITGHRLALVPYPPPPGKEGPVQRVTNMAQTEILSGPHLQSLPCYQ